MKILIPLLLCCVVCFAGTPGHKTVVDCDVGCILAFTPDDNENVICSGKQYITISPDTDNMYHIQIYSGFPVGQDYEKYTTPRYMQDYTWWEDYDRVSLDVNNCLKVAAFMFFPTDVIGLCPPAEYDPPPHWSARTNPYWFFYGPGKSYTESSLSEDEGYEPADASNTANNPSFAFLENPPLFFSGEGGENIGGASVDDSPVSDSIFQQVDDPLSLSSDNNNNNNIEPFDSTLDSNFVANEFGGGDYSLFDGTA